MNKALNNSNKTNNNRKIMGLFKGTFFQDTLLVKRLARKKIDKKSRVRSLIIIVPKDALIFGISIGWKIPKKYTMITTPSAKTYTT